MYVGCTCKLTVKVEIPALSLHDVDNTCRAAAGYRYVTCKYLEPRYIQAGCQMVGDTYVHRSCTCVLGILLVVPVDLHVVLYHG